MTRSSQIAVKNALDSLQMIHSYSIDPMIQADAIDAIEELLHVCRAENISLSVTQRIVLEQLEKK